MSRPKIGVLALQGAFQLHEKHLVAAGADYREVRSSQDLEKIDALILPGGESGVMLKLIEWLGLYDPLLSFLSERPSWGICAGAILMAKEVRNPEQTSFGLVDISVERNAYGRQLESSTELVDGYDVSYIRAPKIIRAGPRVQVFATREGVPVWVEDGTRMITTFHPEVNSKAPSIWHQRLAGLSDRSSFANARDNGLPLT